MVQRGMPPRLRPGSLPDRLGGALEAVVISDRWVSDRRGLVADAGEGWQEGLLHVARACDRGDALLPQQWKTHFQTLPDTAAVLLNALPYLWLQADAYGHHSAVVAGWAADLGQSPATVRACEDLFSLVCQEMKTAGLGSANLSSLAWPRTTNSDDTPLGAALRLVAQSQGEFAVVLGAACQRGWAATEVALSGLVVGLTRGRVGIGACLRQRWLLDYAGAGQDGWRGLEADGLAAIATDLHYRWAGGTLSDRLEWPPFPLGIRV
ncbi:MAG: hypothetical protein WBG32_08635 [Nodosilinea sp.]